MRNVDMRMMMMFAVQVSLTWKRDTEEMCCKQNSVINTMCTTLTFWNIWFSLYFALLCTGHVSAQSDSAEDITEDTDAAVDEEEDEEEVLVEEDQIQASVSIWGCWTILSMQE